MCFHSVVDNAFPIYDSHWLQYANIDFLHDYFTGANSTIDRGFTQQQQAALGEGEKKESTPRKFIIDTFIIAFVTEASLNKRIKEQFYSRTST